MTQQPTGGVPQFTIGDRLRKSRETTGMDQGQFAEHIGVSRGTVSNYERDAGEHPRPIVLKAWAMATGVPLSWIETGVIDINPTPPDGGEALRELTKSKARGRQRHAGDGITANYPVSAQAA